MYISKIKIYKNEWMRVIDKCRNVENIYLLTPKFRGSMAEIISWKVRQKKRGSF